MIGISGGAVRLPFYNGIKESRKNERNRKTGIEKQAINTHLPSVGIYT